MVTEAQKSLVQESWSKVVPIAEQAAAMFYGKLFELEPSVKPLFSTDLKEQGAKLMKTIGLAVHSLNNLPAVVPALRVLGKKHKSYGVVPSHYDAVGLALLDTLSRGLGSGFTEECEEAWKSVYSVLATTMIDAADYSTNQPTRSELTL